MKAQKAKRTENKVQFIHQRTENAPTLETIYLPKWWVGDAKKIKVTVEVIE